MAISEFAKQYNSFSGVDIRAMFAGIAIGSLQAISYSVTREKGPIYTMGTADPRAFARGKRGIAGTMIFIVFDRDSLLGELTKVGTNTKFFANSDDIRVVNVNGTTNAVNLPSAQSGPVANVAINVKSAQTPWYVDQIPPFDVVLSAANEYGAEAQMSIHGAEILNSGYGVSIDDIVSEQQYTYIARFVMPWQFKQGPAVNGEATVGLAA